MEKICDMVFVMKLAEHIDNPCVDYVTGRNIRQFYLNLAKDAIDNLENPYAKQFLEDKIKEYDTLTR